MPTRRDFLGGAMAAGIGSSAAFPPSVFASEKAEIKTALNGPVGLQLWSLREYLPKDLAGTLAKVRAFGFREVEGAGLWGRSLPSSRPPSTPPACAAPRPTWASSGCATTSRALWPK